MSFWTIIWSFVGFSMLLAEIFNPGIFFALSLSLGAFGAVLLDVFDFSILSSFCFFVFFTVVSFIAIKTALARLGFSKTMSKREGTNVDALVGLHGVATENFDALGKGSVKVGSEAWAAFNHSNFAITSGDRVKILKIEGNRLFVSKVEGDSL